MDVRLTEEQELLRRSIREFAEAELRPHVRDWDEAQQFPPALLTKFAELGLMGIQFPESYGGAEMSSVDYCLCIEELARVDPSVCLSVAAHNGLGAAHIYLFGNEAQKQQYLAPLARGEKLAAWGLTESSSGSDAASMQTRAVRDGDSAAGDLEALLRLGDRWEPAQPDAIQARADDEAGCARRDDQAGRAGGQAVTPLWRVRS